VLPGVNNPGNTAVRIGEKASGRTERRFRAVVSARTAFGCDAYLTLRIGTIRRAPMMPAIAPAMNSAG
jgi:hypothetical protein